MAQTLIRLAAGVGAVVAVTVAGGHDVAVAEADSGRSRASATDSHDDATPAAATREHRGPGHGRHRRDDPATPDSGCVDGVPDSTTGGRPSPGESPEASTPSRPTVPGSDASPAPDEAGPAPDEASPAPTVSAAFVAPRRSSGRSTAVQSVTARVAPRVTVGDGRTPRHLATDRADVSSTPSAPAETVSLAAPEPAESAPAALPSLWLEPVSPRAAPRHAWAPDNPVTSLWGDAQPDWPAGVIFGIAGLFLAPVGGVLLGRRQAKASRSASQMISR